MVQTANFYMWETARILDDDGMFNLFLPFSSLNQWIPDEGIYRDMLESFNIGRLANIKALSETNFHSGQNMLHLPANHNRFEHSLLVALVTENILRRNKAPEATVNTGIAAGLLHDIATPAWGDAVTVIDPKNLHEEHLWKEFLTLQGVSVLDKYGVKIEELDNIITNNGMLGRLLDISDRITYVCKDLFSIQTSISFATQPNTPQNNPIAEYIALNLGDIYKEVEVERDNVYFSNPHRLEKFLSARVMLHSQFYLHPESQARDLLMGNLVKAFYSTSDQDLLTRKKLREMNDTWLKEDIWQRYPAADQVPYCFFMWEGAGYTQVHSAEEEKETIHYLEQDPDIIILGKRKIRSVNPAAHYKVKSNGAIASFKDYNPEQASELQRKANSISGEYLIYAYLSKSPGMVGLLTEMKKDGMIGVHSS